MPRRRDQRGCVAEIIPPRVLESGIAAARAMLGAVAGEQLALEVVPGSSLVPVGALLR